MGLDIDTNNSSPRGWQYVLLNSPRSKVQPSCLPFLILFFGVGFLLGSTMWNNTISDQRLIKTNKDSIHEQQEDRHVTHVEN